MEANARQLTLFDRQGQAVGVVGPRDLYNQPVFSPDAKRVAVIKPDLEKETNDLWVIDVATARGIQITSSQPREGANSPAWSPDGSQVAYVALREGYFGLYRKASTGQGTEELLYRNSAPMTLTDWSQDGSHLTYFSTDLSGGGLYALPLNAQGERKPIEVFRNKSQVQGPRLSPDNRFMTFVSNESGRIEIYAIRFDPKATAPPTPRPDLQSGRHRHGVLAARRQGAVLPRGRPRSHGVEVGAGRAAPFGKPTLLFRPPPDIVPVVGPGNASVSRDGERFVIAVPPPQLRQLTMFDRQGKVVSTIGQPVSTTSPISLPMERARW